MQDKYLTPTQENIKEFVSRKLSGPIVLLNLLRFRKVADYSAALHLKPATEITGEKAYEIYMHYTAPFLEKSGGEILFFGKSGSFLIGPEAQVWDAVLMVRQQSAESFLAFVSDPEYQKGTGHRIAALEDTRLLPITETGWQTMGSAS